MFIDYKFADGIVSTDRGINAVCLLVISPIFSVYGVRWLDRGADIGL